MNATNEVLWQKAVRENPDPTWLVVQELVSLDSVDGILLAWFPSSLLDLTICKNGWTPRQGKLPPIKKSCRQVLAVNVLLVHL